MHAGAMCDLPPSIINPYYRCVTTPHAHLTPTCDFLNEHGLVLDPRTCSIYDYRLYWGNSTLRALQTTYHPTGSGWVAVDAFDFVF